MLSGAWGDWRDLQEKWQRVVNGEATKEQVCDEINLELHGGDRRSAEFKRGHESFQDDAITLKTRGSTARPYLLARLERDGKSEPAKAELATKVRGGKLSAHAAAIEAGYRIKTVSVPLDPERAAAVLRKHFQGAALYRLKAGL